MIDVPAPASTMSRRLFVAWQDPETRSIEPVAVLTKLDRDGEKAEYRFAYLKRATHLGRFEAFASFPDINRAYYSTALFPFFANRVLARGRQDYEAMMELLDLSVEAEPFEVLERSGGRRETDRLEVFPEPTVLDGQTTCLFFLRGIRYFEGAEDAAATLEKGAELRILMDVQNQANSQAVLLAKEIGTGDLKPLGYVPDYLAEHVHQVLRRCGARDVRVTAEHINRPDTPRHMRLLCRIESCQPEIYRPFSGQAFEEVVPDA